MKDKKYKTVRLGVKPLEDGLDDAVDLMKRIEKGEHVKKRKPGIYFENVTAIPRILTQDRLKMLNVIKENHPSSISDLAKLLGRDVNNVKTDVQYLSDLGLIKLKKSKNGDGENELTTPTVNYEKLLLEINI
ncbi:MAG: hypothetical protein HQK89_00255 [Nitrospirae bacterium]|nr:hypothetical protein [Nitrospirota bacterium]